MSEHSFSDSDGRRWTACCECDRGGNGNDKDKCSCGFKSKTWDMLGCFVGTAIVGPIKPQPKVSRSKRRYQRYIEADGCFDSFRDFLMYETHEHRERQYA